MSDSRSRYSWRATMSVLISLAFIVLAVSGSILFLSPPGRVANWSDWRMLGYSKHEWADLHAWFAVVFVLSALLHAVFNIRPLLSYFRSRFTRRIGFRWEWLVAVGIAAAVLAGTRAGVPPFSTFLAYGERFKQSWEDPRAVAPIPHAELLTVQELAEKAGVPLETAIQRLTTKGLEGVAPATVIADLATQHDLSAQRVYAILQDAPVGNGNRGPHAAKGKSAANGASGEPSTGHRGGGGGGGAGGGGGGAGRGSGGGWGGGGGGGGPGRMTLTEYCESRGLDVQEAQSRLQAKGIQVTAGRTLREIATENGYDRPFELIDIIEARTP